MQVFVAALTLRRRWAGEQNLSMPITRARASVCVGARVQRAPMREGHYSRDSLALLLSRGYRTRSAAFSRDPVSRLGGCAATYVCNSVYGVAAKMNFLGGCRHREMVEIRS